MNNLYDMHVHSTFSHDGEDRPENLLNQAGELGLAGVCFSEHGDYRPDLDTAGYFSCRHFSSYMSRLKKNKSGSDPEIMLGLEFSEPHIYREDFSRICELQLDMISGAIHWIEGVFVGEDILLKRLSPDEICRRYLEKVMAMVQFSGFDVLSHLCFPSRYHSQSRYPQNLLDEVLKKTINNDIVLEINTAAADKPVSANFFPSPRVLKRYKEFGGSRVVLGSDAHSSEEVGRSFREAADCVRELGLEIGYFQNREYRSISEEAKKI